MSASDARVTDVTLTTAGRRALVLATPGHIKTVRRLVIDVLDEEDLAHLARIAATRGERMDPERRLPGRSE